MPAPPARASLFPAGSLSPASAKTLFGDLYDYIVALLGADGTAPKAREAINVALVNHLDNPDGAVYQRAVAATADDTYMDDRWYALTETGTITPSQVSNPEDGYRHALRLTQSQAAAQRMGRAQIVDGARAAALRGKTVIFGGRFKLSSSANLRMALLAWTGTEDAPISELVNNWASGTYTVGNFFANVTLTLIATNSTALTAATAANVSVSGTVPSTATNLFAFYWTEAAAAQNVTLDAWGQRLVEAATLVDHIRRPVVEELRNCQRFFEVYSGPLVAMTKLRESDRTRNAVVVFKSTKRASPTITLITSSVDGGGAITPTGGVDGATFQNLATLDAQAPSVTSFSAACDL